MSLPQFTELINPVISALRELGGSARPSEVYNFIAKKLGLTDEQLNEQKQTGGSLYENRVAFARFFLAKAGYIDSSKYGVWALTDKGRSIDHLTDDQIQDLVREVQTHAGTKKSSSRSIEKKLTKDVTFNEEPSPDIVHNYLEELRSIINLLPASGFERLCQRLLRESGFQQVNVTGRSGDGGIDGIGILQVNAFVSFKVLFQSKRYIGSVSPSQVRDFRGAMMGRADKGLIITTGTFTAEARKEAVRDGVPPIELIDGDDLIHLFETLELGLKPRTTYDIDKDFFKEFMEY